MLNQNALAILLKLRRNAYLDYNSQTKENSCVKLPNYYKTENLTIQMH